MDETKTFQLRDNNFTKIANGEYSIFLNICKFHDLIYNKIYNLICLSY